MGDPNPNVPHNHEVLDALASAEQLLMFDGSHYDSLIDKFVNDMAQDPGNNVVGNYGNAFSGIPLEENACFETWNYDDFPRNSAFGNPIQIPIWPVPPSPHNCTCCQTLREFCHVNGTHVLKLDIHGRLGVINHAVLERYNIDTPSQNHECYMFDFIQESISNVKEFLVQYCKDRRRDGYTMLQDPLSNFYAALCIGLDGDGSPDADMSLQQTSRADVHLTNQEDGLNQAEDGRLIKSYIATQRERTGKMKLRDLAGYFHLPISDASKATNICPSAIKSICRKEGLLRWPYRKIKSIESKILKKKQRLSSSDASERASALTEIQELQQRLARYYEAKFG